MNGTGTEKNIKIKYNDDNEITILKWMSPYGSFEDYNENRDFQQNYDNEIYLFNNRLVDGASFWDVGWGRIKILNSFINYCSYRFITMLMKIFNNI